MAASIGLVPVDFRILIFKLLFISDFDRVCGRLHCLRACISDSLAFNVAVPFKEIPAHGLY